MDQNSPITKNAAIAYIPFVFIYTTLKYGNDEYYMWHSKMGALSTLIFLLPLITTAYISELIGGIFYGIYFVFIGLYAYKAYLGGKMEIPVMTSLSAKIPLEKMINKP